MRPLPMALALLSAPWLWHAPAGAWGHSGHRMICEIAFLNLTPPARTEAVRLLRASRTLLRRFGEHHEPSDACTFADRAPGREMEHHVLYARTLAAVTGPGCGLRAPCVTSAIEADLSALGPQSARDRARGTALAYLGHWVGDVHQPLHAAYRDDLAGNLIDVEGRCAHGLHLAWDSCIFDADLLHGDRSIEAIRALASAWNAAILPALRVAWQSTPRWEWPRESYEIARRPWVGYCIEREGSCRYSDAEVSWSGRRPRRVVRIDSDYVDRARPIIQERMTQAGIRLAHLLNELLDPAYRGTAGTR